MRTDFTNLHAALDNFLNAMEQTMSELMATANGQRKELLDLYARMYDTQLDLDEFGAIMEDAAGTLEMFSDASYDVSDKIGDVLADGADAVPTHNYEDFVGFCNECGSEIVSTGDFIIDGDGYLCGGCYHRDDEQIAIEIAETDGTAEA